MKAAHKSRLNDCNNEDKKAYGQCDLLDSEEWNNYIDDPTNDVTRAASLDKMTGQTDNPGALQKSEEFQANIFNYCQPCGICYTSMSEDV